MKTNRLAVSLMALIVSVIVLVEVSFNATQTFAQEVNVCIAVGPRSGEVNYPDFMAQMMADIENGTPCQVLLSSNTQIDVKSIVSYGNFGGGLYSGFSIKSPNTLFTLDQVSRSVGDLVHKATNGFVVSSIVFGQNLVGKDPNGDMYPSGTPVSGKQLSELYGIVNVYTIASGGPSDIDRAASSWQANHGNIVNFTAEYGVAGVMGQNSVQIVPEPRTITILVILLTGLILVRCTRKSPA